MSGHQNSAFPLSEDALRLLSSFIAEPQRPAFRAILFYAMYEWQRQFLLSLPHDAAQPLPPLQPLNIGEYTHQRQPNFRSSFPHSDRSSRPGGEHHGRVQIRESQHQRQAYQQAQDYGHQQSINLTYSNLGSSDEEHKKLRQGLYYSQSILSNQRESISFKQKRSSQIQHHQRHHKKLVSQLQEVKSIRQRFLSKIQEESPNFSFIQHLDDIRKLIKAEDQKFDSDHKTKNLKFTLKENELRTKEAFQAHHNARIQLDSVLVRVQNSQREVKNQLDVWLKAYQEELLSIIDFQEAELQFEILVNEKMNKKWLEMRQVASEKIKKVSDQIISINSSFQAGLKVEKSLQISPIVENEDENLLDITIEDNGNETSFMNDKMKVQSNANQLEVIQVLLRSTCLKLKQKKSLMIANTQSYRNAYFSAPYNRELKSKAFNNFRVPQPQNHHSRYYGLNLFNPIKYSVRTRQDKEGKNTSPNLQAEFPNLQQMKGFSSRC